MKTAYCSVLGLLLGLLLSGSPALAGAVSPAAPSPAAEAKPIPWSEIGAKAGAQYSGDGLSVSTDAQGMLRIRCVFQRMEGEITAEGLWLTSTATEGAAPDRFRVRAERLGRTGGAMSDLGGAGTATLAGANLGRYQRAGMVEEYSASMDGVRQDFVVPTRPAGTGALRVELAVRGARAQSSAQGAELVLAGSGRKVAYSRLKVVDATGRELAATLEADGEDRLVVGVDDEQARYPVRIDPTFSDANWISMGGYPGANGTVYALAVDGSGNLYAGGDFTLIGDVAPSRIAKWNGSAWSALGGGAQNTVFALAVSGTDLYVGGLFTSVYSSGTTSVGSTKYIAKWNGSAWSALGSGANSTVRALALSGANLYVGGDFTSAGDKVSPYVARAALNTAPTLAAIAVSGTEDTTFSFTAADFTAAYTDVESTPLTSITIATLPATGTLQLSSVAVNAGQEILAADLGNLTYVPAANANGAKTFTVTASDGGLSSSAATVMLTLAAVNDAPTLTTVSTLTGATEDTAFTISYATLAAAANAADVDGDTLSFRVEAVTTGTLTTGGVAVVAGTTLLGTGDSLVWTPAGNANGTLNAFTIKAWDGTTTSATAIQVQVTVAAVNDAPVAGADTLTRPDSTRVTKVLLATLLANDTDPENDSLSITAVGSALPVGSTVSIFGAFVVYVAPSNTAGNGSFTYTLSDGTSSVTGVVTITETSSSAAAGSPNSASLVQSGSDYVLKFLGVPGRTYGVQYTTSTGLPYVWQEFVPPMSRAAPDSGVMSYTDVNPPGPIRLYRAVLLQ